MNEELIERTVSSRVTRRTIVTTGTKLAYAAPLVAASMKMADMGVRAESDWETILFCGDPGNDYCTSAVTSESACKFIICHRTCSDTNPYVAIEISTETLCSDPDAALAAHIAEHQDHGCDVPDKFPAEIVLDKKLADCGGGVGGPSPA